MAPGAAFSLAVAAGSEAVVFLRKGSLQVAGAGVAGEKDAVFVQGPLKLQLRNNSGAEAVIIHALAPPKE